MTDIKDITEKYMAANGVSRAEVCRRMGRKPQAWANLAKDAKWSVACEIMAALGFDLERTVTEMLGGQPETTGFVECPHCHKAVILKAKEV